MEDIGTKFLRILKLVSDKLGLPDAIIGGGALRDAHLGGEVKDIDIFALDRLLSWEVIRKEFPDATELVPPGSAEYSRSDLKWVANLGTIEGYPVQIIFTSYEGMENIHHFDTGICQIGVGLDGELHISPFYLADATDAKVTVLRCENEYQHRRTEKRIERILAKYPHFTVDWNGFDANMLTVPERTQ